MVIELVLMYAALAAAWFVGGAFLRLDAFGVAVAVLGLYLIVRIGRRQPSPLMACPFCRRAWPGDPGRDRRVTCAGCQMRCRPYLLSRIWRHKDVDGLIDGGTRRQIESMSRRSPSRARALAWAERPRWALLIYGVVGLATVVLMNLYGPDRLAFWLGAAWLASMLIAVPAAIWVSKRRYARLEKPRGTACWRCAYDLTGLAGRDPARPIRCPECGTDSDPLARAD